MSLAEAKYKLYMALKTKGCELTAGEACLLLDLAKDEDVGYHILAKSYNTKGKSPSEFNQVNLGWKITLDNR